jgi:hypothetical protein
MKMNTSHMIIIAAVVVLLSVAYMYMNGGSKKGKGTTIVTTMPQSGYSLDNDGFNTRGLPEPLPESLPPVPEVNVREPEMMGMAPRGGDPRGGNPMGGAARGGDPRGGAMSTMSPGTLISETEEFTQYAPRRFRGDIL